ncbi:hypothetical protein AMATHDRAFT_63603, partial [Amanita thiersii Skay4041]
MSTTGTLTRRFVQCTRNLRENRLTTARVPTWTIKSNLGVVDLNWNEIFDPV